MPKNPFCEFDRVLSSEMNPEKRVSGLLSTTRNPFVEFAESAHKKRVLPMDEILASHASAMDRLTDAYRALVAECVGEGLWQANRETIEMTYRTASRIVGEIDWEMADVEAFCTHALQSNDAAFFVIEPLGLFLSAFCNASSQAEICLDLAGCDLRLTLMGYRLRKGVSLTIAGDLGDLTGISLMGGHLKIEGSVRHYLGAGMTAGRIAVSGNAGKSIGEQMTGGEIHISGRLGGIGHAQGGAVYHRQQILRGTGIKSGEWRVESSTASHPTNSDSKGQKDGD